MIEVARGRGERAGHVHQKLDAEVHLEERVALRDARLEGLAHVASAALGVGVAVNAHAVAELAAEELPHRHTPKLARDVPAGELDRAHAAGLARVAAELADTAEHLLHVERVLAEDAALEHGGVGTRARVAHLAVADEALLVRVELHERAALRRAVDVREADVCDL